MDHPTRMAARNLCHSLCLWSVVVTAILFAPSNVRAGPAALDGESVGALRLGSSAATVTGLLGEPKSKGRNAQWAATGDWMQEWRYPDAGLTLNMASGTKSGSQTVHSITAAAPSTLSTLRGIHVGSSEAEVRKAYGHVEDKDSTRPGKTFVAGSVYGGIIFTLAKGKVSRIFLGAAAE